MQGTPSIRRRLIGATLRRYRESLNLTLKDAAAILECDASKISRVETGHRGIRKKELRELLNEYGAPEDEQDILSRITRAGAAHGWWDEYADITPESHRDCLSIESAASEILIYQSQQIPELFQTEEYAQASAAASSDIPSSQKDLVVQSVLTRQRVVLTEQQPIVNAVIGEGALRQRVGDTGVMRAQLSRLVHLATNDPQITLRVLPFSATATPAAGIGSPTVYRLCSTPSIGVVHQPGLAGGILYDESATVSAYLSALARIQAAALPPAESSRFIKDLTRA